MSDEPKIATTPTWVYWVFYVLFLLLAVLLGALTMAVATVYGEGRQRIECEQRLRQERADRQAEMKLRSDVLAKLPNNPPVEAPIEIPPIWAGCAELPDDTLVMLRALRQGLCRTCHHEERDFEATLLSAWPPRGRSFGQKNYVLPVCADWHPAIAESAVRMDACRRCHPAGRDATP